MYDTGGVCGGQPIHNLNGISHSAFQRQTFGRDDLIERLARDVLHDEDCLTVRLRQIVKRDDIRMIQRRGGTCLLQEPLAPVSVAQAVWGEHLQRDFTPQASVPGPIDLAHTAGPQKTENLVNAHVRRLGRSAGSHPDSLY